MPDEVASIRMKAAVDVWIKQSELFWKVTFATPIIEIAILTAWYHVWKDCDLALAQTALMMGTFIMVVQIAVLRRHAQYLNAFRRAAHDLIPSVPAPFLGMSGNRLGVSIPILLCVVHLCMLAVLPPPKACLAQTSPPIAAKAK